MIRSMIAIFVVAVAEACIDHLFGLQWPDPLVKKIAAKVLYLSCGGILYSQFFHKDGK